MTVTFMIAAMMPQFIVSIVRASVVSIGGTSRNNNRGTVNEWWAITMSYRIIGRRRIDHHRCGYAYTYSDGYTTRPTVLRQKHCCRTKHCHNDD